MDDIAVSIPFQAQARYLVHALATDTLCPKIRQRAFQHAFEMFDNYDDHGKTYGNGSNNVFLIQMSAHAIPVFLKCLTFYLVKENWDEIDSFCRLLWFCFQWLKADGPSTDAVVRDVGADLIITLICCLINIDSSDSLSIPCNAINELLDQISKLDVSLSSLKNSEKLIHLLQYTIRGGDGNPHDSFSRVEAMRILNELARREDNKAQLIQIPSLVDDVLKATLPTSCHREMAAFIRNLSEITANQSYLVRKKSFVSFLLKWNESDCMETRLNVMRCFRNLASVSCHQKQLAKDRSLIKALMVASQYEELCLDAVATMVNLSGQKKSALRMISNPGLLQTLLSVALLSDSALASRMAAEGMKKIFTHIPVSHKSHHDLVDALMQISSSDDPNVRLLAAQAFTEQSRNPSNSFYMVRMTEALNAIVKLANDPDFNVEYAATKALCNFVCNSANAARITYICDAVQTLITKVESDYWHSKETSEIECFAVQALLSLVDYSPRKRIAKEFGLVAALSKFGVSKHEDLFLKQAALQAVIALAPLL